MSTPTGEPELLRIEAWICAACLDGKPSECHTPGCAFWCCPSITTEQGERLRFHAEALAERDALAAEVERLTETAFAMECQANDLAAEVERLGGEWRTSDEFIQAVTEAASDYHRRECIYQTERDALVAEVERLREYAEQKRGGQVGYFVAAAQAIEERDALAAVITRVRDLCQAESDSVRMYPARVLARTLAVREVLTALGDELETSDD